jgi:hypothetical protein
MDPDALDPLDIRSALEQIAEHGTAPKGRARLLDVGTEPYIKYFDSEVVEGLLRHKGATCKIIAGPYGSGKTHLLDLLHDLAIERGLVVVRTDLSQALELTDWRAITRHILESMELYLDGQVQRSLPRVLAGLAAGGRSLPYIPNLRLPHPGMAKAMSLLAGQAKVSAGGMELLDRFAQGEPVTVRDFESYDVKGVKGSLSQRNAELVLRTVVAGVHACGCHGMLLLFDENDKSFTSKSGPSKQRVQRGANLLRRLIDATAGGQVPGLAAVMTVLPTFVDSCAEVYPALGQRLHQGESVNGNPSWRWPYLSIDAVSPSLTPEEFVERLALRLDLLASRVTGPPARIAASLKALGMAVIERQAGLAHRRYVSKALALATLQQMEKAA